MYVQQAAERWNGVARPTTTSGALVRSVRGIADSVGQFLTPYVDAIRGPKYLELLDPRVRARLSEREKGTVNAYFQGV